MSLTKKIFIGLIAGLGVGIILSYVNDIEFVQNFIINGILSIMGTLFINALNLLIVPLVLFSIVCGVTALNDITKLGRIGTKAVGFYLGTTILAITIALIVALIINPGTGIDPSTIPAGEVNINETESFVETVTTMIPKNAFAAFASADMLQVIFIAVFLGVGLVAIPEKTKSIKNIIVEGNELMMTLVGFVMKFAPYAVFALIATTFANLGIDAFLPLAIYILCIMLALTLHYIIVYMGALKFIGKVKPSVFIRKFLPVMLISFTTSSSSATLPETLRVVEEDLGVDGEVASFSLPLGATINMDGTAIMQGVAVIFLANVYGIDLTIGQLLTVVAVAALASVGTAGVPGVGLIMLSMVLGSVGIPIEGIGIIIGVDRMIDMFRTVVNVSGDAVCSILVAKTENQFHEDLYYKEK